MAQAAQPNQADHRFKPGDIVEYGTSGPGGRDHIGEVTAEDHHRQDGYRIRPLGPEVPGDGWAPSWWPATMVSAETPGRWERTPRGRYQRAYPPAPAGHTLPAAPASPSHASPQTEGTGTMSHSGALSPTSGNVPASGNGYTHAAWRTEMETSVAVCNTVRFVLDGMGQSLRRLGAGQTQLKWIGLCLTHIEATVAEAVPFVGEINRRYDPITQSVAAAGGQAEVADEKTYYQAD